MKVKLQNGIAKIEYEPNANKCRISTINKYAKKYGVEFKE